MQAHPTDDLLHCSVVSKQNLLMGSLDGSFQKLLVTGKSHGQGSLVGYSPWGHKRVGHALATEHSRWNKLKWCHIAGPLSNNTCVFIRDDLKRHRNRETMWRHREKMANHKPRRGSGRKQLLTPSSQTPSLQYCEKIYFCYLSQVEKLSSTKPALGSKKVGDWWLK